MGNGETQDSFGMVHELRFALLQTTPIKACRKVYPFLFWRKTVLCAQDQAQNKAVNSSICTGDSGSPLVTVDGTLVGVANLIPPGKIRFGIFSEFFFNSIEIQMSIVNYYRWLPDWCSTRIHQSRIILEMD